MITLVSMLRIPVSIHNVEDEKIYRPHLWTGFGAGEDKTSTDYRAYKEYGPLYK